MSATDGVISNTYTPKEKARTFTRVHEYLVAYASITAVRHVVGLRLGLGGESLGS